MGTTPIAPRDAETTSIAFSKDSASITPTVAGVAADKMIDCKMNAQTVAETMGSRRSTDLQELLRTLPQAEHSSKHSEVTCPVDVHEEAQPDESYRDAAVASYKPVPLRAFGWTWGTALSSNAEAGVASRSQLAYNIVMRDLELKLARCVSRLERGEGHIYHAQSENVECLQRLCISFGIENDEPSSLVSMTEMIILLLADLIKDNIYVISVKVDEHRFMSNAHLA
jgi:hypothetical protein